MGDGSTYWLGHVTKAAQLVPALPRGHHSHCQFSAPHIYTNLFDMLTFEET
jgi:hypothetical protein